MNRQGAGAQGARPAAVLKRGVVAALFAVWMAGHSGAQLVIELEFEADRSENPSFDTGGDRLQAIMEAAARYWMDCYPYPHVSETIEIRYYWQDLADPNDHSGPLAWLWTALDTVDELAVCSRTSVTAPHFRIRFDTTAGTADLPWYIDETPWEHSEYWMGQSLYENLSATQQADWFGGSVPDAFEATFGSNSAPHIYSQHDASSLFDLYTVALHEIGHAVGCRSLNRGTGCGSSDHGYFEIDPDLIMGAEMCIRLDWDDDNSDGDISRGECDNAHLEALTCLRSGLAMGERYLPTHTDVLLIAAANGWDTYQPPRANYVAPGGGAWNLTSNWYPNASGPTVDAMIVDGAVGEVFMNVSGWARSLWVWNGNLLRTSAYALDVEQEICLQLGTLQVEKDGFVVCRNVLEHFGTLLVNVGGVLNASDRVVVGNNSVLEIAGRGYIEDADPNDAVPGGDLTIWDHGLLNMAGGQLSANWVTVNPSASGTPCDSGGGTPDGICGGGTVDQIRLLQNSGNIAALQSNLHFQGAADTFGFDLDGPDDNASALISAATGSIYFELAPLFNNGFRGAIYIDAPNQILMTECDPRLHDTGRLTFADNVLPLGTPAALYAEEITFDAGSQLRVESATDAVLNSVAVFLDGSSSEIGGRLALQGETHYWGGSIQGGGTLDQRADAHVRDDQTIQVAMYNWDGEPTTESCGACSTTTVHTPAQFRITGQISAAADGFDGEVIVEPDASVLIDQPWKLEPQSASAPGGRLTLAGGSVVLGEIENDGSIRGQGHVWVDVVNNGRIICNEPVLNCASSAEFVGEFWLGQACQGVI